VKKRLKEVCEFYSGTGFPIKYQGDSYGDLPFYKVSDIANNEIMGNCFLDVCNNYISYDTVREIKGTVIPRNVVVFAKIGEALKLNRRCITSSDCLIDNNVMGIGCNEKYLDIKYFYFFMKNLKLEKLAESTTVPSVRKTKLEELFIEVPNMELQLEIARTLEVIQDIILYRQKQLMQMDKLIKARFVEMFGDTIINSRGLNTLPMSEICEIIDGDRGKNYPTADEFYDEGYCLFLNAKNVTSKGFCFDDCMFISKEKNKLLRNGKLNRGDIVLTTRGTLGNLAFYGDNISFENIRINSGMVILRMRNNIMNEIYFIEQFKMKLDYIKKQVASGSAQPQLPISTIKKIHILIPDIEKQREFAEFVQKVNKSKVEVQKALDKAQLLFDSLMQKYFG